MQTVTDALAHAVGRVTTGARVRRSRAIPTARGRVAGTRDGEEIVRRARAVVLAAPAYEAATLVRELAPAASEGLAAIPYAAIASVASAYRRADIEHSLAGFGFLVPKKEQRRILGSLFSSSMFEGRAPRGSGIAHLVRRRAAQSDAAGEIRRGDRRRSCTTSSARSSAPAASRCGS